MSSRAVALIDRSAIEANCRRLRRELTPGVEFCAVVKGNGYGHGMAEVAVAARAGGADRLAVATAGETAELVERIPGAPIVTLGALDTEGFRIAIGAGAEVTVWNLAGMRLARDAARALGRKARIHVKFDSGMGRYGVRDPGETQALARQCSQQPELELTGLWTHFATADDPQCEFFSRQLRAFEEVVASLRAGHPGICVHAANSAATLREPRAHFDMVRCGVATYGLDPFGRDAAERELRPALTLKTYVAAVRTFEPGSSAGYSRTWRAPVETRVATLPIGYGDGVLRVFSNNGDVLIAGNRYPIVGNVSMDNITVDLGPGSEIEPGEEAILIGSQAEARISAEEVAARIGTINYEVTTALSARVTRECV